MASASVSGLVSGLDTATIISQLMQVEAAPQTLLKTKLSSEQTTIANLQSLNAKFAALTTRAEAKQVGQETESRHPADQADSAHRQC